MSGHHKTGSGKPHPQPNEDDGKKQKRQVSGEVHVRGEIEANVPANFIEQYKAARQENTSRDNWRFFVEIATLVFVIAYSGLTALMYIANKKSADAAKSAADTAATSLRIDQRAWVGLIKVSLTDGTKPVSAGKPIYINVEFKNLGKTPAYNVVGHARATTAIASNLWDHSVNGSRYGLLQPNGDVSTTVIPFMNLDDYQPVPLTQEAMNQLKAGNAVIYVSGWMTYEDLFRNPHWVEICYFLLRNLETFAACGDHNGDDYDKNRK